MKIKRIKLSVRAQLIFSFALIVLVSTVVVNILFFAVLEKNYTEEIDKYHHMTLEILSANLDKHVFEPARTYASEMAANSTMFPDISAIIRRRERATPIQIRRVYDQLRGFSYHDIGLFSDVMIYFGDQNMTVASGNGVVYLDKNDMKNPGRIWWVDALERSGRYSEWMYGNINPSIDQRGLIYAVKYPSVLAGGGRMNAFAFQYPERVLNDFMRQYEQVGTNYFLINGGALLYGDAAVYGEISESGAFADIVAGSGGTANTTAGGPAGIVSVLKSDVGPFALVAVTSPGAMYARTNTMRVVLQGVGVLTFAAGLLLSYFLTRRLYRPLRKIRTATETTAVSSVAHTNEYDYINAVFQQINAHAAALENTVAENEPVLKAALLERLLTNMNDFSSERRERAAAVGMPLDMPYFRVIRAILPQELAEALSGLDAESIILSLMHAAAGLSDALRYTLNCLRRSDREFTILVNCLASGVDGNMQIAGVIDALSAYAFNEYNVPLKYLVSGETSNIAHIYQLDEELDELGSYLFFMWDRCVLRAEDIPAMWDNSDNMSNEIAAAVSAEPARGGDAAAAVYLLQSGLDAFKTGRYQHEQCRNQLMTILHIIANRFPHQPQLYARLYEAYLKCGTGAELADAVVQTLEAAEADRSRAPEFQTTKLIAQRAAELIRDNAVVNYTIEDIAAKLNISAGYLSRLFRDEYGVTPSEYYNSRRLERSVEYLTGTEMRIEEVAEKVGYSSTAYFIKKFRERYGITPKNYRMNHILARTRTEE